MMLSICNPRSARSLLALLGVAVLALMTPQTADAVTAAHPTLADYANVRDAEATHAAPLRSKRPRHQRRLIRRQLREAAREHKRDSQYDEVKMDGLAVAGFVCSIVGIIVAGLILGPIGIIFSAVALNKIKRSEGRRRGRGLAIAGLVLGIIAVIGALIVIANMNG